MTTYASLYFRPGMNRLQFPKYQTPLQQDNNAECFCQSGSLSKINLNNGIVNPTITQNARAAQIINYSQGGRVKYGNSGSVYHAPVTFLGKTEGQPGGLNRPLKNRF